MPYVSTYPHNVESLIIALRALLPDDRLVDLAQIPFGLLGAVAIAGIARRCGAARPPALAAGAAWVVAPAVFLQMPTDYVDVASAALFLSAIYFVLSASRRAGRLGQARRVHVARRDRVRPRERRSFSAGWLWASISAPSPTRLRRPPSSPCSSCGSAFARASVGPRSVGAALGRGIGAARPSSKRAAIRQPRVAGRGPHRPVRCFTARRRCSTSSTRALRHRDLHGSLPSQHPPVVDRAHVAPRVRHAHRRVRRLGARGQHPPRS